MPVSLLDQLKRSAMLTAQIGMATRAQYSKHVPSNSTTVHILATGLETERYNLMYDVGFVCFLWDSYDKLLQAKAHKFNF